MHLEIELAEKMRYQAGDHVGIYPENDSYEVNQWIDYFKLNPNQIIAIAEEDSSRNLVGPCSVRKLLTNFLDLVTPPRKKLLHVLSALYTSDESEKKRLELLGSSSDEGWKAYNEYVKNPQRTLMEVLQDFPSCKPTFIHMVELSHPMKPRYYSISSSPKENPNRVHVTAVITEYKTGTGRFHKGICTSWFSRTDIIEGKDKFMPCFIRNSTFKLPKDPSTPIIMIGPGTGIAPFRGFLQDRRQCK